jgi:hypothetical protein
MGAPEPHPFRVRGFHCNETATRRAGDFSDAAVLTDILRARRLELKVVNMQVCRAAIGFLYPGSLEQGPGCGTQAMHTPVPPGPVP